MVEIVPLEVVVRDVAAGSLSTRLGIAQRHAIAALDHRVLLQERCAARSLGFGRAHHSIRLGDAPGPRRHREPYDPPVDDFLSGLFLGVGIKLVDFKLEFGRLWENDFMRMPCSPMRSAPIRAGCGIQTNEKLDDQFRRDLGGVTEAYSEVARRLRILPK